MAKKDPMKKRMNFIRRRVEEIINSYEETPYGCGYNIGAEARRRAQAEKIRKALEEKSLKELEEYLKTIRKAG